MQNCNCGLCQEYTKKENIICDYVHCFLMFNRYPYLAGHIMLVPKRPVATLVDLTPDERVEIFDKLADAHQIILGALGPTFGVTSTNTGINIGPHSGGSIPTHLHIHIVPRRLNDTNFMHTCMFNGFSSGESETSKRDPIMFSGLYENARKWIIEYVSKNN